MRPAEHARHGAPAILDSREDTHPFAVDRVFASERPPAVPVRHDAVGNALPGLENGDFEQIPGASTADPDRTGDDVRSVDSGVTPVVRGGERDRIRQDAVGLDPVGPEKSERIPTLVLMDALVADRVDRDLVTRIDREHGAVSGAGQSPPEHRGRIGGQVMRRANRADTGLEHPVLHHALAFDSGDSTGNTCFLNLTDGRIGEGNAMRWERRSAPPHSPGVDRHFGLGHGEPDRQSRGESESCGATR